MFSNIIYVLATSCLLAGSSLTFYKAKLNENSENKDRIYEAEDYLYLLGTLLFFIKSVSCLSIEIIEFIKKKQNNRISYYNAL